MARAKPRTPAEERAVAEAAARLLSGRPLVVATNRLSVVELAIESGIDRTRINRYFIDEKDDFIRRVEELRRDPPPASPRETELVNQIAALQDRLRLLEAELGDLKLNRKRWKEAAEAAFRIINVLEVEVDSATALTTSRDLQIARQQNEIEEWKQRQRTWAEAQRSNVTALPGKPERRVEVVREPARSRSDDD